MNFDKGDFIAFCKMYQKANECEYEESELTELETGYSYIATFRDEYNYQIRVHLYLEQGIIGWDEPNFNEDEEEDTKPFFHDLINEVFDHFKNQNPLTRFFSPSND